MQGAAEGPPPPIPPHVDAVVPVKGPRLVAEKKEHLIHTPTGDHVSIPIVFNNAIEWAPADKAWRAPAVILYDKLIGSTFLGLHSFNSALEGMDKRPWCKGEKIWMIDNGYFPSSAKAVELVDTEAFADYIESLGDRFAITATSLRDIPDALTHAKTCLAGAEPFPKSIPPCIIPKPNLRWPYSLSRLNRPIIPGPVHRQMRALSKSKLAPTIGLDGNGKKIQHATDRILQRSLEEYLGFAYLHLGLTPTLKSVMRPAAYAHFVSFQRARGLKASTQLRAAQQVSSAVDFVASGE